MRTLRFFDRKNNYIPGHERNDNTKDEENGLVCTDHLPKWLKENQDRLFKQGTIEKKEELGNGQYGVVYKGAFSMGKAL